MKNHNLSTSWNEKENELRDFNKEIKRNGHSEKFRLRVTNKVVEKGGKG